MPPNRWQAYPDEPEASIPAVEASTPGMPSFETEPAASDSSAAEWLSEFWRADAKHCRGRARRRRSARLAARLQPDRRTGRERRWKQPPKNRPPLRPRSRTGCAISKAVSAAGCDAFRMPARSRPGQPGSGTPGSHPGRRNARLAERFRSGPRRCPGQGLVEAA